MFIIVFNKELSEIICKNGLSGLQQCYGLHYRFLQEVQTFLIPHEKSEWFKNEHVMESVRILLAHNRTYS